LEATLSTLFATGHEVITHATAAPLQAGRAIVSGANQKSLARAIV